MATAISITISDALLVEIRENMRKEGQRNRSEYIENLVRQALIIERIKEKNCHTIPQKIMVTPKKFQKIPQKIQIQPKNIAKINKKIESIAKVCAEINKAANKKAKI